MATRKNNLTTMGYTLVIQSVAPTQDHYGTLLGITDGALILEQKRPRSPKLEVLFIPKTSIVYWYGVVGEAGGAYICRRVPMGTELFHSDKNPTANIEDNGDGTFAITLTDGTVVHVSASDMTLVAQQVETEATVAAAPRRAPRQATEKAPAAKTTTTRAARKPAAAPTAEAPAVRRTRRVAAAA